MQENEKIIIVDIENEMKRSFLDYSMSVIVARALPDARDGLKPVHRRILYTLFENNLTSDKPYRKCADTVGSVLGRYHPHGDASVYDALVRMAQDFSIRYTLIDGHGNFGSVDGDPPAAYRYTEARMSKISAEALTDIEKNTVDFIPNYDDRLKEPIVLPARFPNLLINGSTGIAVGMATNIPPHNLSEVIDGICCLIDNPEAECDEIMKHIKGPDFPTGGIIMGLSGIKKAYATGRGKVIVRAKAEIIEEGSRYKIIVTEIPYQVNKARLIESIADLAKNKRLEGISKIEDHSDRKGMSIEISVKQGFSPQVALNQLYSFSQMQTTFGIITLAIVNGEPKVLTLKECLKIYINFQVEIITRRTQFELGKARERTHILEGLKIAIDNIDEVIRILRSSKSVQEGKQRLSERFQLSDIQTQAIVQMQLGKLTGLEIDKIENEIAELLKKIAYLEEILSSREKLFQVLKEEIFEIKNKYKDERRTAIETASYEVEDQDLIPHEERVITLTEQGYIKTQNMTSYKLQKRGGRGIAGMTRRESDFANKMLIADSHDYILFFSNLGRVYRLKCFEIPDGSRTSKGLNIVNLLPLAQNEKINAIAASKNIKKHPKNDLNESVDQEENVQKNDDIEDPNKDTQEENNSEVLNENLDDFESTEQNENTKNEDLVNFLVMVTKFGVIKRTKLEYFNNTRKSGIIAIDLDEGDELAWVRVTDGMQILMIATYSGKAIRFKETGVRSVGRSARGVRALKLKSEDFVVGLISAENDSGILTVSETGYGRISRATDYRLQSRGGNGVINYHTEKFGKVASVLNIGNYNDFKILSVKKDKLEDEGLDLIVISSDGVIIRIDACSVRCCARPSKGVRIMKMKSSKVVAVTSISKSLELP
ncbi:MAG: DNA gyrase subunit A [Oscillospiraceae bacterium]|jgi:DNA gyrase subunit A|nr:DNA gyrase subunit A [Oscillospiraceae bacterium]